MSLLPLPILVNERQHLNAVLAHALTRGASDVFIKSGQPCWASVYGKKRCLTQRALTDVEVKALISDFYGANGPSILGGGQPIDTAHEYYDDDANAFRFRVNAVNDTQGVTLTFRSIPSDPPSVEAIALEDEIVSACLEAKDGLILVVGATGSGKSTTLASVLRHTIEREGAHKNVVTFESPVEFVYDEVSKPDSFVTQIEIPRHLDSFALGVRNAMRMAPDIILVGETRDKETLSASIEAAKTGHVVYSTVHSNNVPVTLGRLMDLASIDERSRLRHELFDNLRLVMAQTLLPSTDGKRVACREWLVFDESVRRALYDAGADWRHCLEDLVERKGCTLAQYRQRLIEAGSILDHV